MSCCERYGVDGARIDELNWTQGVTVAEGALEITAVPARHFSGRGMLNRFETLWSAFVLKGAKHKVYFGADSGWWEGFAEIGAMYGPFDLTMLEIGAFNELWEAIHLGPEGAARAFAALGGKGLMMPIHWGLFDLALHAWRQPMELMLEIAGERGISSGLRSRGGLRRWCVGRRFGRIGGGRRRTCYGKSRSRFMGITTKGEG